MNWKPSGKFIEFLRNKNGSLAAPFALTICLLMLFIAVAIDFSRLVSARKYAQNLTDHAVLTAATTMVIEADKTLSKARGENHFNSVKADKTICCAEMDTEISIKKSGTEWVIQAVSSGNIQTTFAGILGKSELPLTVESESRIGVPEIEVILALDVSASMQFYGKMTAMTNSYNEFISILFPDNVIDTRKSVTVIPYGESVRFGQLSADWTPEAASYEAGRSFSGCIKPQSDDNINSNNLATAQAEVFKELISFSSRRGYPTCPDQDTEVVLFNSNPATLTSLGNNMDFTYGTGTDIALSWAWRLLTPEWRGFFNNSAIFPRPYSSSTKFIVLLTDGNAKRMDPNGDGVADYTKDDPEAAELAMNNFIVLCNAIKLNGNINLYSIGYDMDPDDNEMHDALRNCHAGTGKFYDAGINGLTPVFEDIAVDISDIRISH